MTNVVGETRASDRLRRIAYRLSAPLGALASLATLIVMIAIVADVIFRNVTGSSVPGLLELSESGLVAAVFLGLAYAGTTDSHVSVDLLTSHINQTVARILITAMWIASVLITVWFMFSSVDRAVQSFQRDEVRTGLVNWSLWPSRWLIVVGFAAFLIVAIINVVLLIMRQPVLGKDQEPTGADQTSLASPASMGDSGPPQRSDVQKRGEEQ